MEKQRLDKIIASTGRWSRREVKDMIRHRLVVVDGVPAASAEEKADPETFSCLFCYCPLYALGDQCGGNFSYTESGIKDCSKCLRPHRRENYDGICRQMVQVMEMVKKP